jgi:tetratricopeptide (TPR) repeat protein
MLAKIFSIPAAPVILALALLVSGCTPAGPRALLKGKRCLDRGNVAEAVTQFRRATSLLATNAGAWNYLGVALQRAGQPEEAAAAYQNALRFDRDLVEVYFNLGQLSLEENKPEAARAAFTAYTLRRPNDPAGWLKLGFAQLRAGDTLPSERSFSTVLSLKTSEADAYNGLGLARLQQGKPREAAQFFAAALQARPDFAPALQNLATVNLQYLHDNRAALANFESYLALSPRPANYSEVKAIVASLTQTDAAATIMAPAVVVKTSTPPPEPKPKVASAPPAPRPAPVYRSEPPERTEPQERPAPQPRPEPEEPYFTHITPRPAVAPVPAAPVVTQPVRVQPAPQLVVTPKTNRLMRPTVITTPPPATNVVATGESLEVPMPEEETHHGFWHRLFNAGKTNSTAKRYREDLSAPAPPPDNDAATPAATPTATPAAAPATPAPAVAEEIAGTKPEEKPAEPKPVFTGPRYSYSSPAKPAPGDRHAAEGPFTKARMAEQDENWTEAEQWYQTAADADPSWFEAQFNTGVIAHRLHSYSVALPRYELALAIQPASVDARYNFALALKGAGYALDAADELKRILASNPDEVRAQLALANLCAQSLHDIPQARQHYLRVLELQPDNPQAADIRFWLSANANPPK